jgi:hypothetical protein
MEELGVIGCWRRDEPPGELREAFLAFLYAHRPPAPTAIDVT